MVPSMALIFFASSSEELALVRLITEPVVPLPILLWEVCALVIPAVVPIRMIDDNTKSDRMFFIINTMATNYLMIQDLQANASYRGYYENLEISVSKLMVNYISCRAFDLKFEQ